MVFKIKGLVKDYTLSRRAVPACVFSPWCDTLRLLYTLITSATLWTAQQDFQHGTDESLPTAAHWGSIKVKVCLFSFHQECWGQIQSDIIPLVCPRSLSDHPARPAALSPNYRKGNIQASGCSDAHHYSFSGARKSNKTRISHLAVSCSDAYRQLFISLPPVFSPPYIEHFARNVCSVLGEVVHCLLTVKATAVSLPLQYRKAEKSRFSEPKETWQRKKVKSSSDSILLWP